MIGEASGAGSIGALHLPRIVPVHARVNHSRCSGCIQSREGRMSIGVLDIFEDGLLSNDLSWWTTLGRHCGNLELAQVAKVEQEQDRTIVQSNCSVKAFRLHSSDGYFRRVVLKQVNLLQNKCVSKPFKQVP
jgi:hypothetical protein